MHRLLRVLCASSALCWTLPALAGGGHGGHGGHDDDDDFVFVEENDRLPPNPTSLGTSSTDVDLVDVDDDGDLDLFLTEGTAGPAPRPNRLYINDGTGRFTDETALRLLYANADNNVKTDFGDIDGDGDLDAIVGTLGQERLLLNDGLGHFILAFPGTIPLYGFPERGIFDVTADVRFVDLDGDGALDILIGNENPFAPGPEQGLQNRLYMNDGSGLFFELPLPPAPGAGDQTAAMLPGDIDGDGDLDVVVVNRGQERILIGDGAGGFVEETATRIPLVDLTVPNVSSARGGGLADLDRDGDLDLIIGNSRGQAVEYFKNDGHGVFLPADFRNAPGVDETITGLVLVDLDGDDDLDVYLPNAGRFEGGHGFFGGPDRYFRNNGRGRFSDRTTDHFDMPADPSTSAAFGDIDDDGDLDLVVGNTDDDVEGDTGGERVFIQRAPCRRWCGCH